MATPGIPSNFNLQTANAQNYLSWSITAGATLYNVQRSTNGVDYTFLSTSTTTDYLDTSLSVGTQYWYKVAAYGGSPATLVNQGLTIQSVVLGTAGNSITVQFTDPGTITAGSEVVEIIGTAIIVQIEAGVSTQQNIVNAINASLAASALIEVSAASGASSVNLLAQTPLSGGSSTYSLSAYTAAQSCVPTTIGEMSLGQIRLNAQQRADRVSSPFVTLPEWNSYINQSLFELYDILVTQYGDDYFAAPAAMFVTNGSSQFYPLPDGFTTFTATNGTPFVAPALYKLLGVDLGLNASNSSNGWVTLKKFNFNDRNKYFYPNSSSTIYGVYNASYRILGNQMEFIPVPSANQPIRLWYIPKMTMLLKDTDISTSSISGWIEYVIVDAAIKALQKEESDTSVLMIQKAALMKRIEAACMNRDAGFPDTISDVRGDGYRGGSGTTNGYGGGPW